MFGLLWGAIEKSVSGGIGNKYRAVRTNDNGQLEVVVTEMPGGTTQRLTLTSGIAVQIPALTKSFQAVVTGTGAVSCDVAISISNDNVNFTEVATMHPAGTNSGHDEVPYQSTYLYTKAVVSNLTGTGAACVVTVGY